MFNEMMRAEIWLQDHLESQKGIEDLASRLGYSTSQVRRRFKQCFGLSPSAYRDSLRLEKAARLLAFTPLPIQTIATRCGYQNHSAFSRAFQRYHNQTPRQYRQAIRLKLGGNPFCMQDTREAPAFEIQQVPVRHALVTRLYHPTRSSNLSMLKKWHHHAKGTEGLSERLKNGRMLALMHNIPLPSDTERIDVGPLVNQHEAPGIPVPPSFRVVKVPSQYYACVALEALEDITDVLHYLISEGLPAKHYHATGEALQVEWAADDIVMRLPVQKIKKQRHEL